MNPDYHRIYGCATFIDIQVRVFGSYTFTVLSCTHATPFQLLIGRGTHAPPMYTNKRIVPPFASSTRKRAAEPFTVGGMIIAVAVSAGLSTDTEPVIKSTVRLTEEAATGTYTTPVTDIRGAVITAPADVVTANVVAEAVIRGSATDALVVVLGVNFADAPEINGATT